MDNFTSLSTSLYPVNTEGGAFYDYSTDYEGIYAPPPSYEQTLTTSSVPWLLSEMTEVQNSILPREDCEPHIELATLDFDVNLLQVANSQNMEFNNTNPINYENISHLNQPQSELSYVPLTPPLRRSPRLARKKKQAENILQLPPDLLFLEETAPISSTCLPLDPMQMQIPCKNSHNSSSYLNLGSNNSQYLCGNLDATISTISPLLPLSTYSSPTHLPTSPVSTSPQQSNQQNSGYNVPFAAYSSPSHFRASTSGTSPQQTNQQNSVYNVPFADYSSPLHLTALSSAKSPQQTNQHDSAYNATLAYSSPTRLSSSSSKSPLQTILQDNAYSDSLTRYTSLTNLTASSTSSSPQQTNLPESRYNDKFTRYTSLTNLTAPSTSTSPQQLHHQGREYYAPLPTYSSPAHFTTSPLSISPHQENYQSSSTNTTVQPEQCSPLPNFSTIKPPPSYPTTILPPPSYQARTKPPPSYSTVEMMLTQRKSAGEISQILSSPEISDDNMNAYLPSSSVVASPSTSSSIVDQNIPKTSFQSPSSSICKKSDEEIVSKRARTKRLSRASYECMSESERSQHNKNLSQQRCVRYRVNKKLTIKEMEKELDILEDKKKQLKNKFEALKLTKQKVEQLMPAFLRNS